jgi:hypothetical protein
MATTLDLNDKQQEILREILNSAVSDLRYEIADTDNSEFKDNLKVRRDEVAAILEKLG